MLGLIKYYKCDTGPAPGGAPLGGDRRRGAPGRLGEGRDGRALAIAALVIAVTAGLLAAQPGGWIGAPSGDGGAAVPDAWPPSGDAAFAGLLPGYAFAQSVTQALNLTAADSITDAGTLELDGAQGITTFESGGRTYAAVASLIDAGVQILDVTDPSSVTAAGSITDTIALSLDGAWGIATFESGGGIYAAVASNADDGVQILDITDPSDITAVGSITDSGSLLLDGASGITTFESGGSTYAAVASVVDDGVQILNVTDPSAITATDSIGDTRTLELDGAQGIATFTSGGSTYAAVAAYGDDGVQILDVTDPSDITAADSIANTGALELDGPYGIATFTSGGSAYAAVTSNTDAGVQILDITDPSDITAAGSITDTLALSLVGAEGIAIFAAGGSTYAAVAAYAENGVQILNITDPSAVTAAGSITDGGSLELAGASSIAVFESGGSTYAAVTAYADDGVQILRLTGDAPPITPNNPPMVKAGADQEVVEGATVALSGTVSDDDLDDLRYSWTHDGPSGITFANPAALSTSFVAPNVAANTTFTVTLTVNDGTVDVSDTLQVTITDSPGLNLPAAGSIDDGGALLLNGARGITTFKSGGSTYAAVASSDDKGVQILNVTDPSAITTAGSITDTGTLELDGARGIATFTSGGSTYAAVASSVDDGVQILNITDPFDIAATDKMGDGGNRELDGAQGITIFESGGSTYAAVAAYLDDGVQILNVTDPSAITAADSITDDGALLLNGARGITTFKSGGSTYAAVAPFIDRGVQILNITDPSAITAAGSITDNATLVLRGARGITTFESGGSTYAAVAADTDDGVQILNVTDPSAVTAAGSIIDTVALELDGAEGITTFESGGSTYAAVASSVDDGVQILDITDPSSVIAAGSITDTDALELNGASGITTFESGGSTYAAVAAYDDDGVQILRLAGDGPPVTLNSPPTVDAGSAQTVDEGDMVTLSGTAFDPDGDPLTYMWTHDSDLTITFADDEALSTTFTAPQVTSDTTVTFTLAVSDDTDSVTDTVSVTVSDTDSVSNTPPDGAFVTTWETTGASQTITIPVDGAAGNYTVHWGDGNVTTHVADAAHEYAEAGNHTVSISGNFTQIRLDVDVANAAKLQSIDQWGNITWTTMKEAFREATNMVYNATDAPDLSGVTSMQNMFRHAEKFDGDLSGWNVSGVANMDGTFRGASEFDGDLSAWDTSGSTDMQKMFQEAISFDGDLSAWDTSGVANMASMFHTASAFDGNISGWNTSSVEGMRNMFLHAAAFNADISGWNVSGVTDMYGMFASANSFSQNLSGWDVSNVTNMEDMFLNTQSFNGDISTWNVSSVTTMGDMFLGAAAFNGDISGWNVSAVTNMGRMLDDANSFDQNLGNWHIVLDGDTISGATETLGIGAQNSWLSSRTGYGLGTGGNSDLFVVNATDKTLGLDPSDTHSNGTYLVNITSTGGLGDNNHRAYNVTVTGLTPPDDAFVTTWEVETFPYVIHMPVEIRSGATATIDWGDGSTTDVGADGTQQHTYADAGNYTVAVTGGLGRINLNESPSAAKLASLDQWGDMEWTTMEGAFRNAENMAYDATDAPDLSDVSSMQRMFAGAQKFSGDLSGWDVSGVTNMKEMFSRARSFNGDISTWNVSGATDMNGTFASAIAFDGDISTWNVSGVTDMESMFGDASSFNGDISTWNVSSVKNMENMFNRAVKFNQDLSGWDVSSVEKMGFMFHGTTDFNQNLSSWDVSSVTTMFGMFQDAAAFSGDLSGWNPASLITATRMFKNAPAFDGDLSGWDVSKLDSMGGMFQDAAAFDGDVSTWNLQSAVDMTDMFRGATAFNGNVSAWDVSNAAAMTDMFRGATAFDGDLSGWDVSSAVFMNNMFRGATAFNSDISDWDVSSMENMENMFGGATAFNSDISGWDVSGVLNMNGMFTGATSFQQNLGEWYIVLNSTEIDASGAPGVVGTISAQNTILRGQATYGIGTGGDLASFNIAGGSSLNMTVTPDKSLYTVNVTSAGDFGTNNHRVYNVTVTGIDTTTPPPDDAFVTTWEVETSPYVIHMPVEIHTGATATIDWGDGNSTTVSIDGTQQHTYADAGNYTVAVTGGLGRINTSQSESREKLVSLDQWGDVEWTTMAGSFSSAENMAYDATDAPDLSGVTSMQNMFRDAEKFDGDLSSWDVSGVTDMKEMFHRAASFNGDISTWDVSKVEDMNAMFASAIAFDGDISSWNTSGVTDMELMFSDASSFNGDISTWNVSSVTDMQNMFSGAATFNQNLSAWDVSSVTSMSAMFRGAAAFNQNLSGWDVSKVTHMIRMFEGAADFDGDLSGWNPASLTATAHMFRGTTAFNADLSGWDVSKVTSMANMFRGATAFDGDISTWDVSSVADMTSMFHGATAFDGNVSAWDPLSASLMTDMFRGAAAFDGDLSGWDVSGAFFMNDMFRGAAAFNSDISDWDVSNVLNMNDMFEGATSFQQNLGKWYIVLDDTSISADDAPGVVDSILTQSLHLDGHNPAYAIGTGGDSTSFNITGGSDLNMNITSPAKSPYTVNITASGDDVFGTGNHRVYNVTVTGLDADAPTITINGANPLNFTAGIAYSDPGAACDDVADPDPTLSSDAPNVDTQAAGTYQVTYTCTDSSDNTATAARTVHVTPVPEGSFVTTWSTASAGETITIPVGGAMGNYAVHWGDGSIDTHTGDAEHEYASAGSYKVSISGEFTQIRLDGDATNARKLASIDQWGEIRWASMSRAFADASSMTYNATDAPDLSGVTSMGDMFRDAAKFDGDLSGWNVSAVTNMNKMFWGASVFDGNISSWDVSAVTDMQNMFRDASSFNADLSGWDVSNVIYMSYMFGGASVFDGNISGWNTSSVSTMEGMFQGATAFNADISGWNVSGVFSMADMFDGAASFRQNLGDWYVVLDDTTIDLASGTTVGTISPQNGWLADNQNGAYGIAGTHDHGFFEISGTSLNVKDGADYTGKTDYAVNITSTHPFGANNHRLVNVTVTDTSTAFKTTWNTATPNEDITIPATGSYDIDWGDGTAESVTGPKTHTYADAGSHAVTVSGGLTRINLGADPDNAAKLASIDQWGDMEWTTMEGAFHGASNMAYDAADTPDLSGVASMNSMFRDTSFSANLSGWNVSSVTDTGRVFQGSSFNGDISGWDVSRVQGMRSMFSGASSFNQPLDTWNVSSATNMAFMFYDAYRFNQDLGSWTVSSVDTMEYMFGSSAVHSAFNGSISTWDVSQVTNMEGMFGRASSFNGDLSGWDVSSVTDMESMFLIASSFDQPLNDWNVSRVQSMRSMFSEASSFDQPLNDWNVSSVTDMEGMFRNAASFNQPLGTWNVSLVANMDSMFSQANDFDQNLGEWYVVLNSTSINAADAPGVVGGISAQNRYLNGQTPTYAIGTGGDSGSFNITGGSDLNMNITSPAKSPYVVNITSAGGFGDNNHRVLNVTVVGTDSNAAPVLDDIADQEVEELQPLAFTATASDDDAGDILVFSLAGTVPVGASIDPDTGAFSWIPGADQSGTHVITVRVSDGEAADSEDVTVTVTDSATAFVTTWKADTSPDTVSIPVRVHSGGTVTIHWGDGSNSTASGNGTQTHTYQDSGRYQVAMTGDLSRIIVGGSGSTPGQLRSIDQWGNGTWGSMQNAFKGAMNMVYKATDTPDLSGVTSMDDMFRDTFFTGNLSGWDVSNVETMRGMFYDANHFDGDLSGWNVSAVTHMHSMFRGAHNFDQPLSSWNTSGVTDMRLMFHGAQSFNGDISPWDTSGAETMRQMFHGAVSFNGTISGWDVSGVTNMRDMFNGAEVFNRDISGWNVSGVTNMRDMFNGAEVFNRDISGWNVSSVTNMADMFNGATAFRQNLGDWYIVLNDTSINAAGAPGVVGSISAQNQYLNDQTPTYAIGAGGDSGSFNITGGSNLNMNITSPAKSTYVVNITSAGGFDFSNHRVYNVTVTGLDTTPTPPPEAFVTTWKADTSPDTVSIPVSVHSGGTVTIHWGDGSNSTVSGNGLQTHTYQDSGQYQVAMTGDLSRIIMGGSGSTPGQLLSIDQWGNGTWGSMQNAFKEAVNMEYKATDAPDLSRVTNMEDMFYDASSFNGSLSSWNVSSVTRMNYMFSGASSFNGSLSGWNVSSVTGMGGMFRNAASFNQPLNDWNVSSVTGMEHMFSRASSFNQPLNGWNVSSVTSTEYMFAVASSFNQSLNGWDVSSVTGMTGMFNLASSFDRPLNDWDVSSVTSTEHMFNEASSFNRPLNDWNVSSVTDMDSMFRDATAFNGSLSGWNVSSVNRMDSMFAGASSFNGNISSWDVSSVTRMNGMFNLASSFNGNISSWNVSSVSFMLLMFNGTDSFDQNLGEWYVTLDSASIVRSGGPGVVGTISAQNQFLRDQNATYGIGAGGDFGLFAIHDSNRLNMTSFGAKSSYVVNVTASGSGVFEDGNNWHALEVTLAGEAVPPEGAFVTTWRTNSTGQSVTIPVGNATGSYTVDWGDGSITTHTATPPTRTPRRATTRSAYLATLRESASTATPTQASSSQ